MTEDERYVKKFYPKAKLREIHHVVTKIGYTLPVRYFVGIFQGPLAVNVLGAPYNSPQEAWASAKKRVLRDVLRKFENDF